VPDETTKEHSRNSQDSHDPLIPPAFSEAVLDEIIRNGVFTTMRLGPFWRERQRKTRFPRVPRRGRSAGRPEEPDLAVISTESYWAYVRE
jgi:hypothetical protein